MTEQEVYAKIVECRTLWSNRDVTVETMENIIEDMSVMLFACPESVYWSVVATIEECGMRMRYLPSNKLFIRKQDEGGLFTTGSFTTHAKGARVATAVLRTRTFTFDGGIEAS